MSAADLHAEIKATEKLLERLKKQYERLSSQPAENAAPQFPYSPRAQKIKALHNSMTVEQMKEDWKWAPNPHMAAWYDLLGEALEAGRPHRDADGRWWTMERLWADRYSG